MIKTFKKVNENLYRGGAPNISDIFILKKLGINKIISLDSQSADKIKECCKRNDIEQVIIPLYLNDPTDFLDKVSDIVMEKLFNSDKKIFIHCKHGKDRTGFFIALYRTLIDNWDCKKAIKEAKLNGFGTGITFPIQEFLLALIRTTCNSHKQDINTADDAVSMSRDTEFMDNAYYGLIPFIGEGNYPRGHIADVETTYPNRADYQSSGELTYPVSMVNFPQVGVFEPGTALTNLTGPSLVGGGGTL